MGIEKKRRRAVVDAGSCVACGCCVKVGRGIAATVDESRCVGCGSCARECPASVISVREVA